MASASLTHVCRWSENGWKRITAEQAAKLHPGGTVSAHSGLFMCELCGQYVILTNGSVNKRRKRTGFCLFACNLLRLHALCPGMVVQRSAEWFYEHLKHRMGYFGLSLEEEKNNKQYFTRCKVVFYRI